MAISRRRKASRASTTRKAASTSQRRRAKPGARGGGAFFHIVVRPRSEFVTFRTQDVGRKGGIERVAGRTRSGRWLTQKWLISKDFAHRLGRKLVPDSTDSRQLLKKLGAPPRHVTGDRFVAKDRPNVPERLKPTRAQLRAIRKAQAARRRRRRQR